MIIDNRILRIIVYLLNGSLIVSLLIILSFLISGFSSYNTANRMKNIYDMNIISTGSMTAKQDKNYDIMEQTLERIKIRIDNMEDRIRLHTQYEESAIELLYKKSYK